jgi:hypothetical protein
MSSFLPISSKNYLLETLSSTERSRNIEFLKEIAKSPSLKLSDPQGTTKSMGSGMGTGAPKGKKEEDIEKNQNADNVLFGDTEKDDWGLGHAAGAYAIGKIAGGLADTIDASGAQKFGDMVGLGKFMSKNPSGFFGDVVGGIAKGAVSAVPGVTSKLLRQVADISGANWFDANIGNIGQSQMQLAAQGAGKPWTPLVVPKQAANKVTPYDPNYQQNKYMGAAEKAEKITKLRKKGYNIP